MLIQKGTSPQPWRLSFKPTFPLILSERIWWHAVSTTADTTPCEMRRMCLALAVTRSKPSVDSLSSLILSFSRVYLCTCAPARVSAASPLLQFRWTPQCLTIWSRPGTAGLESERWWSPPARIRNEERLRFRKRRRRIKTSKTYCLQVSPCE